MVETEIRRVNIFEKQWKIRTNGAKLKLMLWIAKKMNTLFYNGSNKIKASSTGRFLSLIQPARVFSSCSQMAAVVGETPAKENCLSGLSTARKRTIHSPLVTSRIFYPISSQATMTPQQIFTLKAVQTHGVDFIGNRKSYERLRQKRKLKRYRI